MLAGGRVQTSAPAAGEGMMEGEGEVGWRGLERVCVCLCACVRVCAFCVCLCVLCMCASVCASVCVSVCLACLPARVPGLPACSDASEREWRDVIVYENETDTRLGLVWSLTHTHTHSLSAMSNPRRAPRVLAGGVAARPQGPVTPASPLTDRYVW